MLHTIGISPKVLIPAIIALATGFALYLLSDHSTGLAIIIAGLGQLGIGYLAPPGNVQREPGNDTRLPGPARKRIGL